MPPRAISRRRTALTAAVALLSVAAAVQADIEPIAAARRLIDDTKSDMFHLDLQARGKRNGDRQEEGSESPWLGDFVPRREVAGAVTIGHPIRRMLVHFQEEGVGLEEAMSWAEGEGKAADVLTSYRRGYQLVDNYLVRVLAGRSAWDSPPGRVGKAEFQAARIALGKFEVLIRADCLAADLPLLAPYLAREVSAADIANTASEMKDLAETKASFLPLGTAGMQLLRGNRWDLQLWDFAQELVLSRSTSVEGYLCGSSSAARSQRMPGEGRRAVVYNSPSYHLTGVAMFSCALLSLGFDVTAVIKDPGAGFKDLLPCPHRVVTLNNNYVPDIPGEILNAEVSTALGLPPFSPDGDYGEKEGGGGGGTRRGLRPRRLEQEVGEEGGVVLSQPRTSVGDGGGSGGGEGGAGAGAAIGRSGGGGGGKGPFDLSVLCTAVSDLNHLMKSTYPVDARLVDALMWNVDISIWNVHSVEAAFRHGSRMPASVNDFARRVPSAGADARTPPPSFITLYGEHVKQWEHWSEEAYEGWGWGGAGVANDAGASAPTSAVAEYAGRGNSTFGGMFRRPGVVYPIHPTGHMRLPRPKLPFKHDGTGGDEGRVTFVVQGNMQSYRRDYKLLTSCLEAMCQSGRDKYSLVAVGARGDMPDEINSEPCVESRTTEWRHLGFPEFYANISAGHFVVTAAAGHDYEFDRATSTVPTALLLERPLVMSSTLLDAYPCLRKSRVHSLVANDNLCLNLEAAYDLSPAEYEEMELEARDCKMEMWRQTRQTIAGMGSGWTLG